MSKLRMVFTQMAKNWIMKPVKRTMQNLEVPNEAEMKELLMGVATLGISVLNKKEPIFARLKNTQPKFKQ